MQNYMHAHDNMCARAQSMVFGLSILHRKGRRGKKGRRGREGGDGAVGGAESVGNVRSTNIPKNSPPTGGR